MSLCNAMQDQCVAFSVDLAVKQDMRKRYAEKWTLNGSPHARLQETHAKTRLRIHPEKQEATLWQ